MDTVPTPATQQNTVEVAGGHLVHTCCGKLDDEQHRNFCEHYSPAVSAMADTVNASIVLDAQIALEPFRPTDAEQAANMLLFWVRRHEMTDADVTAVCSALFPKPLPLMPCPDWCTTDHSRYSYDEIEDLANHERDVLIELSAGGRIKRNVSISVTDNLTERRRDPAGIYVSADDAMTPEQARRMVAAIDEALAIIG